MVLSSVFGSLRAVALLVLVCLAAAACGDDESTPDGDAAADGDPDAEDLCAGRLTFEALVTDVVTGEPVFEVTVREDVADDAESTTSAPNGRAVLCVEPDIANDQLRSEKRDYLPRVDRLSNEAQAIYAEMADPYPIDVLTAAASDDLLDGLGLDRDVEATQVLVSVRTYPGGEPLIGAEVTLDQPHDGAFAREARGRFVAGAEADTGVVVDGGAILFANVRPEGEAAAIAATVVRPGRFRGTCQGPSLAGVEPGGMSGVLFACQ